MTDREYWDQMRRLRDERNDLERVRNARPLEPAFDIERCDLCGHTREQHGDEGRDPCSQCGGCARFVEPGTP